MGDTILSRLSSELLSSILRDPSIYLLRLGIEGVEVTQAIQYYGAADHLTDPADRGPDNSVRLVSGKPAWVRVYPRAIFGVNIVNVTGTIDVQVRSFGFLWTTVATLNPQPPGTVSAPVSLPYAVKRGTLSNSLNFIIPADRMFGHMRLIVRIQAPGVIGAPETQVYLDVTLQQTLRLAGIMVAYNGSNGATPPVNINLPAPTVTDLQNTSGWTLLTFPVRSVATYRSAGTINWTLPLTDAPACNGCCTNNWVALNAAVQNQKVADGNHSDVIYYGLLPAGIPRGPIIGCESSGVSSGAVGDQITMAHEIGHFCGRPHSPCGTPGDANYPAYEPYDPANTPQASIGEYGLDISSGSIFSPASFKDFMSYCGPKWISLYVCGQLTNNTALDPILVGMDHPWWKDYVRYDPNLIPEKWLPDPPPGPDPIPWRVRGIPMQRIISIIGTVFPGGEVTVQHVARTEAEPVVKNGAPSGIVAELVNAEGKVVAKAEAYRLPSSGHGGCGCSGGASSPSPYNFQAFIPDNERGAALRLRQADKEIWTIKAGKRPPKVSAFEAKIDPKRGLRISWKGESSTGRDAVAWLRCSADKGKTWRALATNLTANEALIPLDQIPAGEARVQLLVHDGFETAVSKPVAVQVPASAPNVSILRPLEGNTFIAGYPLRLWGVATEQGGDWVDADACSWTLDGKDAGRGLDVFIAAPKAGRHKCTLSVRGAGGRAEQTVTFETVEPKEG
jgi:hypothetical protein